MKERIGESLVLIGFLLMAGVAGADDFQTMTGHFTSMGILAIKCAVPLIMMVAGLVLTEVKND